MEATHSSDWTSWILFHLLTSIQKRVHNEAPVGRRLGEMGQFTVQQFSHRANTTGFSNDGTMMF